MTDSPINNPHDRFTRQSLMHLPTARSFLEHYLPPDVVQVLDVSTITRRDGSFLDERLRENLSDLLFEVSLRDEGRVLVGILFEHKSFSDKYVALQLTRYMVNIWEQQRRDDEELLVVIPIVLYHGRVKWNAATSLRGLIAAPSELARFIPDSETCLVDLSTIPDAQLGDDLRLQIMLRVLKYVFDPNLADRLVEVLPLVEAVLIEENSLQLLETLVRYIYSGTEHVKHEQLVRIIQQNLNTETHVMPTIADELRAEGREEGREEGLRIGIRTIVEQRFPTITVSVMDRVDGVTSTKTLMEILLMADRCESASEFDKQIDNM